MRRVLASMGLVLAVSGCSGEEAPRTTPTPPTATTPTTPTAPSAEPAPVMPDLVGLPATIAGRRIVRLGQGGGDWRSAEITSCEIRPGTIVRQEPAPATELQGRHSIRVWIGRIDLSRFRGPCETEHGSGSDAALARAFYEFAADPGGEAPFADTDVWVGIEGGPTAVRLDAVRRSQLDAWEIGEQGYAERVGPFSALDVVAESGGYYQLERGVPEVACTPRDVPPELADLRVLTMSAAPDVTTSCIDWWAVSLFLDADDRIRGVALRLGSP